VYVRYAEYGGVKDDVEVLYIEQEEKSYRLAGQTFS
jgi:hypothetical protein